MVCTVAPQAPRVSQQYRRFFLHNPSTSNPQTVHRAVPRNSTALPHLVHITRQGDLDHAVHAQEPWKFLPKPGDNRVDNSTNLWTPGTRENFIHRCPETIHGQRTRMSTWQHRLRAGKTRLVHTIHNAYYCYCF
jgi:hypothetical protein